MSVMEKEYTVYKGVVVSINPPSKDGKKRTRQIMVAPKHKTGIGPRPRPATPPSWIPTTDLGSGVTSYPDVGQECLVAEYSGQRHILVYTPHNGSTPYGLLQPHSTPEGGVAFGVQGIDKAFVKMDREGGVALYSNMFAQVRIRGDQKSALIKGHTLKKEYAGGWEHHIYDKESKQTTNTAVYTTHKDNPGLSDVDLGTEEVASVKVPPSTPQYNYVDKAIIQSGHNEDNTVWNLETRQNLASSPTGKDVFTNLRIGYQTEHERWGSQKKYPAGNIIEWTGKRNVAGKMGSFMFRWGKLESNYGQERTKGEIFRQQVFEGLNEGQIYGNPQTDPAGRGQGYSYGKKESSGQYFTTSFGRLDEINSSLEKNSLYRLFLGDRGGSEEISHQKLIGGRSGDLIWGERTQKGDVYVSKELIQGDSTSYTIEYGQGDTKEVMEVAKEKIMLKSSKDVHILIEGEKIELKMKNSTLEMTPDGLTYNGQSLVFSTLVDFLKENANMLGIDSKAAPVAMHPTTQGKFLSEDLKKHVNPHGFRTKK